MNRTILYMLTLGTFLTGFAELAVIGILPTISQDAGISIAQAGQLVTAFSLGFAVGTPIFVSLTQRISRRRLLAAALLVFAAGSLLSYFSEGYATMIGLRALIGAGAGVYLTTALGALPKLMPAAQLGRPMSTVMMAFSAASVLGAPIGIALADGWSWQAMYLLLGAGALLVMLGVLRLMPEVEGDAPVGFGRQFAVLGRPALAAGLLMSLLFSSGIALLNTYFVPFLQDVLGLKASFTGLTMLLLGLAGTLATRFGGGAADRLGPPAVIVRGLAAMALALALMPLAASVFSSAAGGLSSGIAVAAAWMLAYSAAIPAIQTYFVRIAPESANIVLGLNTSLLHLGVAIGSLTGGLLADASSTVRYHPWAGLAFALLSLSAGLASFAKSGVRDNRQNAAAAASKS
ncbi:MFS transporter [Cohnella rhizosphaerae]|uniref:MFS transporter n=1 Tax=Cohnella rhizosphaerae TaxID=1457232 RepID=A0A9X4QSH9_9BACL|nr:MFS transporter [Cohnella rhizosphaerae]MDG0809324.1 MFS transporter [Cohnella rhizosphaerae]